MGMLLQLIGLVCGIGSLVCLILVLIQMFQRGQTGLGIACAVGILACGIGALIAFIFGWINATAWNIKNVMLAWTACIIVSILCNILIYSMFAPALPQFPH
jgi:hypothetical protein